MLTKVNLAAILLLISMELVASVPTSVLIKDSKLSSNLKVKRSSNENIPSEASAATAHSSSITADDDRAKSEISISKPEIPLNANNDKTLQILQKRGINSQLLYGDLYNPAQQTASAAGNGAWADEVDPAVMYSDLQEFDEYQRAPYRNKPYDNLQSMLNSETYPEPIALPLQYPYRYLGDRKKRSYKFNKYADMPLKRETQLTPADMLALVALVEAGERSHQDSEADDLNKNNGEYMKPYYPSYEYQNGQNNDDGEYANSWMEPAMIDYYGMPYNLEAIPKYEIVRDNKLNAAANRYPAKRFMVSKKKRSLGHFLSEPVAVPSIAYLPSKGSNKHASYF